MSRVVIDRNVARQVEQANGGHVLAQMGDGKTYRYGSDGVLRLVTPDGGRNKKERRKNRNRVRALEARLADKRDFARED